VAGKEPSGAGPVEPTPPPKNYVYGDVNGDGKVNSTDCSIVKRYLLKNIEDSRTSMERGRRCKRWWQGEFNGLFSA